MIKNLKTTEANFNSFQRNIKKSNFYELCFQLQIEICTVGTKSKIKLLYYLHFWSKALTSI
jgi:hypothetical protein